MAEQFKVGDRVRFKSAEEYRVGTGFYGMKNPLLSEYTVRSVSPSTGCVFFEQIQDDVGVFPSLLELVKTPSDELKPGDTIFVAENNFSSAAGVGTVISIGSNLVTSLEGERKGWTQCAPPGAVIKVPFAIGDRIEFGCDLYGGPAYGKVIGYDKGSEWVRFELEDCPGLTGQWRVSGCRLAPKTPEAPPAPPSPTVDDYFEKKADKGKLDYTLLPADACAFVLEHQTRAWPNDDHEADSNHYIDRALTSMFAFRVTGCSEHLAEAFVYGAAILGMSDGIGGAFSGVVEGLEFGARKYSRDSWKDVPNAIDRYWSAAMRHLEGFAVRQWENPHDEESGLHHIKHFLTNVIFLVHLSGVTVETVEE